MAATKTKRKPGRVKVQPKAEKRTAVAGSSDSIDVEIDNFLRLNPGVARAGKALQEVSIGDLKPDPQNARKHNPRNIGSIVNSLQKVGAARSIVIDEHDMILAGHGLVEAAGEAGITKLKIVEADGNTVIAVRRTGLTPKQKAELAIADNRTAELAEWDAEQLLKTIAEYDIDIAGIEFNEDEIRALQVEAEGEREVIEDELPTDVETRCKFGDLWQLGEHRLLCGDSTKAEDVGRVLDKNVADMMFADPPYGVEYVGKTADALTINNDDAGQLPTLLDGAFAQALAHTAAGAAWYVAAPPGPLHWEFARRLMELGVYRQTLVWVKDSMVLGHSDYHYKHEPIFYGWKPGAAHRAVPDRTQVSVWEIPRPKRSEEHPTMKPVELVGKCIANSSDENDIVYDPFLGSGTTMIAAEQLGRRCYGIEIAPKYCDVILARWEKLTGKQAELIVIKAAQVGFSEHQLRVPPES